MKILYVEDNPIEAKQVSGILSKSPSVQGEIVQAQSLSQALQHLNNRHCDVILTDLNLPDSTGLETFLRIQEKAQHVPIVILTGTFEEESMGIEAVRHGAQDYLHKEPFDAHLLTRVLKHAIERKRLQEKLSKTIEELVRSNRELEHFAYIASHDLREPLRMVGGFTQLLAKKFHGQDPQTDEHLRFILDGVSRMQTLIEDVLAYSQVSSRTRTMEIADLNEIVAQALKNLTSSIAETGTSIKQTPLPKLKINQTEILQLFQNLIANAIKFRGKESPQIQISAKKEHTEWIFSVRDNGIGIDSQYSRRIFEIFQRLHSPGEYSGSGIGLAICKKVVENHDGRIWVESQPGVGSTFYFTLPEVSIS
jgi:light-regulated signal transduction histidine kinase (bacteriophytochrome)